MESPLLSTNEDEFDRHVQAVIGAGDTRGILDWLDSAPTLVDSMRGNSLDAADIPIVIGNLGSLAAVAIRRRQKGVFAAALDALLATYRLGDVGADTPTDADVSLWEPIVLNLWAIGAVATKADGRSVRQSIAAA